MLSQYNHYDVFLRRRNMPRTMHRIGKGKPFFKKASRKRKRRVGTKLGKRRRGGRKHGSRKRGRGRGVVVRTYTYPVDIWSSLNSTPGQFQSSWQSFAIAADMVLANSDTFPGESIHDALFYEEYRIIEDKITIHFSSNVVDNDSYVPNTGTRAQSRYLFMWLTSKTCTEDTDAVSNRWWWWKTCPGTRRTFHVRDISGGRCKSITMRSPCVWMHNQDLSMPKTQIGGLAGNTSQAKYSRSWRPLAATAAVAGGNVVDNTAWGFYKWSTVGSNPLDHEDLPAHVAMRTIKIAYRKNAFGLQTGAPQGIIGGDLAPLNVGTWND